MRKPLLLLLREVPGLYWLWKTSLHAFRNEDDEGRDASGTGKRKEGTRGRQRNMPPGFSGEESESSSDVP
jgi:hypothetical protein